MLNPVGLTGLVALHSIRSGISRLTLQPFPDRARQWIGGASIPKWTSAIREERLSALAVNAVGEALERAEAPMGDPEVRRTTAVILGSAEGGRPGYQFPHSNPQAAESIHTSDLESMALVETISAGACSVQVSLSRASELLATGRIRRCVVGAVDTQLQLRTIRWLEDNRRLKCSYITDGLMPAEAAVFLVLEPEELAQARGATTIARIVSVNIAREEATILSDQPNTAAGLTKALRSTLGEAGLRPSDIGMVWSDLNGESYRAREWAFAEVRLGFTSSSELMHPADCHGDLGVATDANLLSLAALCHGTGWSDGKATLVFSGSEGGCRAATVLTMMGGGKPLLQVSKRIPRVLSDSFRVPRPPNPTEDFRTSDDPPRAYFEWQLREEHRDELASLHYQRNAILRDPTIPWPRLREPEQRMLNHLDAAVAAGPTSMAAVASAVNADEEGLCFAGSLLLGTLPCRDNLALLESACDEAPATRLAGITAGLVHAPVSEMLDALIARLINRPTFEVKTMAIAVAAKRRMDVGPLLTEVGEPSDAAVAKAMADAAWRLRLGDMTPLLQRLVSHQSADVRRSAMLALLCLLPSRTAAFARSQINANTEFGGVLATCLGIAGQLPDAHLLMRLVEENPRDIDAVSALGILGAPESVPYLIRLLEASNEKTKVAAGDALNLISGLHAVVRVSRNPESGIETDEPGGDEVGDVIQANTSTEYWANWWHRQRSQLQQNVRWRRGSYFSLASCIDELGDPKSIFADRMRAYIELSARTPARIPFEADWFVARQEEAIGAWRLWWDRSRGAT